METLAQFHFQTVHFPIALSFAAWLLMLVGVLGKKEKFFTSGRMVIYLASLGAIVAMSTGLMAEEYLPHSHAGEIHSIMEWHETLGITLTCGLAILSLLCFWESRKNNSKLRVAIVLLLLLNVGGIAFTGFLGGRLGHEFGIGIKKEQQQPIEQLKDGHEGHEHHNHSH